MSKSRSASLLDARILLPAIGGAFRKLDPRSLIRNPVMFVVATVSALTHHASRQGSRHRQRPARLFLPDRHLACGFTVLFANFAEAVAEGRGKAQADALRRTRTETQAKLLSGSDKAYRMVPGHSLKVGDVVLVEAGDIIPSDGEVVEGVASVNEAAITGESAPVIRESGGDRSAVTGGTEVLSDWIRVRITAAPALPSSTA